MSEITQSTNEDIYVTWGKNKTRVDLPAYGPEFAKWKTSTPPDIQKTILDFMIARNIEVLIEPDERSMFMEDQIPKEKYAEYRERAIAEAKKVATSVQKFLTTLYPELVPSLLAVGLDGSSLYRPRKNGDIDIWILFPQVNRHIQDVLLKYHEEVREHQLLASEVQIRPVSLHPTQKSKDMGSISCLAFPHLIVRRFNLEETKYKEAVNKAKESVRRSRKKIYDASRNLVNMLTNNRELSP